MNYEHEMVTDSLDSEPEEIQPLGNLLKIMEPRNCDKNSCIEDSDETVLDTSSLELTVTQSQPRKQIGSDEETCLSSEDEDEILPFSQISLFSSQSHVKSTIASTTCPTLSDKRKQIGKKCSTSVNNEINLIVNESQQQSKKPKRKYKKKKISWTTQQVFSQTSISCSQVASKTNLKKPFLKKHYVFMEEINIIESKLSSIEKLISTRSRQYVEQADVMMQEEINKRIETISKNNNQKVHIPSSSSELDSEEEIEINQLQEIKKSRLNKVIMHQEKVMDKLKEELDRQSDNDDGVEASQSILSSSSSLYKLRPKVKLNKQQKRSTVIMRKNSNKSGLLHDFDSNNSVIYIPLRTGDSGSIAQKHSSSSRACKPQKSRKKFMLNRIPNAKESLPNEKQNNKGLEKSLSCTSIQSSISTSSLLSCHPISTDSFPINYQPSNVVKKILTPIKPRHPTYFPASQNKPEINCTQEKTESTVVNTQLYQPQQQQIRNNMAVLSSQKTVDDPTSTCLDLSVMLKLGIISLGSNCLSFTHDRRIYKGSIVGKGVILSHDYVIYSSPMTWMRSFTSKLVSRAVAYKKVLYHGVPLFDLLNQPSCGSNIQSSPPPTVSLLSSSPEGNSSRSKFLNVGPSQPEPTQNFSSSLPNQTMDSYSICRIRLVQDNELFITTSLFDRNPWSEEKIFEQLLFGAT